MKMLWTVLKGVFLKNLRCWAVDPRRSGDAEVLGHLPEHRLPIPLAEDVQPPVSTQVFRQQRPGLQQAVEALLVVEPADGDDAAGGIVVPYVGKLQGGVGNDLQVRQSAPVACILAGQDDEPVEPADDALVLPGAEAVGQSQQSASSVLQTEKLAVVQF